MLGTFLRFMVTGEAGRRMGERLQELIRKNIAFGIAAAVFLAALVFAILAAFWAFIQSGRSPVSSALIMASILALCGCLIAFIGYGITRESVRSAERAIKEPAPEQGVQLPATVEDVGRQIEHAVAEYGPARVLAAAVAVGLVAGFLARRTRRV